MQPDYSFQPGCVDRIWDAVRTRGVMRLLAAAPCGAGKTNIMSDLFLRELERGGRPIVYTNRKVIRHQLVERLQQFGMTPGIRAAGEQPEFGAPCQVSSIPTELRRSLNPLHPWALYDATLAFVDEAHSNKADTAQAIIRHHSERGCPVVGFTATPVGLGGIYDELLNLVKNSELRRRGVIVPCDVFAPAELDMSGVDLSAEGDYVQSQVQARFENVKWAVLGNVFDAYLTLNPDRRPAVLFPPGVPESRWFRDEFIKRGVPAEHIDAETRDEDRRDMFQRFASGETRVLCSYGVLAEGWDLPVAAHCMLCRPVAATTVYLQLVGRILRAAPGKSRATLVDHVGAWHRPGLGSPNQDREWKLEDTNKTIAKAEKQFREQRGPDEEREPARCPQCSRILAYRPGEGFRCVCGHVFRRSVRMVIQLSGKLERKVGATIKRKLPKGDTDFYRAALFAAANSGRTVGQAYGIACAKKKGTISRAQCDIWIPEKASSQWHMRAADVYPWAAHRRHQRARGAGRDSA